MEDSDKKLSPLALEDLAAVSAIAPLDEAERNQAIVNAIDDPEFAAECAKFEAAVASLAYAAPPVPMAADLKQRLITRIEKDEAVSEETSELLQLLQQSIAELKQQAADLPWSSIAEAPGFEIATWKVNEARRETALFVRAAGEGRFPNHVHATGEVILVLDGDVIVGDQTYREGDRIISKAGSQHGPETRTGCLLLCISSLDDRIL